MVGSWACLGIYGPHHHCTSDPYSGFWLLEPPSDTGRIYLGHAGREAAPFELPRQLIPQWESLEFGAAVPGPRRMRSTGAVSKGASSGSLQLYGTNGQLCLRRAADERLWYFPSCSYLVFSRCPTHLSTWTVCSKLLQAQTHHEHLLVWMLLVSWLCWTSHPGESRAWGFRKCCAWGFIVEPPVSFRGLLHRCFWFMFLFKTVGLWWTLYYSLCSEKNSCWSV